MLSLPWWVASIISNAAIICTEYLNRTGGGAWTDVLPKTIPLIIIAQWGLFACFSGAPSWFQAWMFFTIGNSAMRVIAVYTMQGQEIGSLGYVGGGVAVMLMGSYILKHGLS